MLPFNTEANLHAIKDHLDDVKQFVKEDTVITLVATSDESYLSDLQRVPWCAGENGSCD